MNLLQFILFYGVLIMSYHIFYDVPVITKENGRRKKFRVPILSCVCFCIFLLIVKLCWSKGHQVLGQVLFGGDIQILDQALRYTAEAVMSGQTIPSAIESFCKDLLYEARLLQ